MQLGRFWRHLIATRWAVRRVFPDAALLAIEAAVHAGERLHDGEVRFAVETELGWQELLRGITPRQRAIEVFSLLRVWDTERNNGVLIYLLFADRDVEIVADRGIDRRVGQGTWEELCRGMEAAFRAGRYADGVEAGIAELNALLETHFPRGEGGTRNELPDRPVVM